MVRNGPMTMSNRPNSMQNQLMNQHVTPRLISRRKKRPNAMWKKTATVGLVSWMAAASTTSATAVLSTEVCPSMAQVDRWNGVWTTQGCAHSCPGDGRDLLCAYHQRSKMSTNARRRCQSYSKPTIRQSFLSPSRCELYGEEGDADGCVVECLYLAAFQAQEQQERNAWKVMLNDNEELQSVGELVTPSHISHLSISSNDRDSSVAKSVQFLADLSGATYLNSMTFSGIHIVGEFPSLPVSLAELHIVDCIMNELPWTSIFQMENLSKLSLDGNKFDAGAKPVEMTNDEYEFVRSRLLQSGSSARSLSTRHEKNPCAASERMEYLQGMTVCVSSSKISRRLQVATISASSQSESASSSGSGSGSLDNSFNLMLKDSTYLALSLIGPGIYLVYKFFLYCYFKSTYARQRKASEEHRAACDFPDDRTTTQPSSPRLQVQPSPTAFEPRRVKTYSANFWVDEELEPWRLDFKQIKLMNTLMTTPNQKRHTVRRGSVDNAVSGNEVWLGMYTTFDPLGKEHKQQVVLKWIPPRHDDPNTNDCEKFKAEVKRQAQFSHPNVVAFIGITWSMETHLVAVTEYMSKGDLRQWLHRTGVKLSGKWSAMKVQMLIDMTRALIYLHSMQPRLVHGNFNSRNVLLNDQMRAKLSDFGSPKEMLSERERMAYSAVGSGRWISPEVFMGRDTAAGSSFSDAADVYSLGIIMSEMDTHELPFSDLMQANRSALPETDILQLIAKGALSPTLSPTCHPMIGELINACTEYAPKKRPSSKQILQKLQQILVELKEAEAHAKIQSTENNDDAVAVAIPISDSV